MPGDIPAYTHTDNMQCKSEDQYRPCNTHHPLHREVRLHHMDKSKDQQYQSQCQIEREELTEESQFVVPYLHFDMLRAWQYCCTIGFLILLDRRDPKICFIPFSGFQPLRYESKIGGNGHFHLSCLLLWKRFQCIKR